MGIPQAAADSEVKAKEIVEFFVKSAELGAARGICIGTAQECDREGEKPSGFDMLINFDLNSADLTPKAQENLNEFAKALSDRQLSSARFVVEGHTDASGAETYNLQLSERRAQAVTDFLYRNGVSNEKVSAVGMGEKNPRVSDPLDGVNRRVEMRIQLQ
ncbi:OmpA family protein [Mesorhizobium sp. AaZ16]|jgi:outer membrane protein OmpA-like peptidoglycan-associated protein|uniref:OmpA family protein n=1 Tax=Mesorhizobium sp. AaZ16 TaxID=3402289 RepID=UPI00374F24D8